MPGSLWNFLHSSPAKPELGSVGSERALGFREHHHSRLRKSVVHGITIGIDIQPEITQPQQEECRPGGEQAHNALLDGDQLTLLVHQLDPPGKHAQCLATMCPEPQIEGTAAAEHQYKQDIAEQWVSLYAPIHQDVCVRTADELQQEAEQHPDRGDEEGIVE